MRHRVRLSNKIGSPTFSARTARFAPLMRGEADFYCSGVHDGASMCCRSRLMKERYFDDLKVGDRFKSESLRVTEKKLIEFAHKFDPQCFISAARMRSERFLKDSLQRLAHRGDNHATVCANTEPREGRNRTGSGQAALAQCGATGDVLTVETKILGYAPLALTASLRHHSSAQT